ncbi:polyadenylate-binding protein 1 [Sphaeroforma arctica JP610]|uniref:Polyadenylate-binding protein n=1 Tax=Sphaeroforma arctica JP610 TaxID=667725 RepID=A0A0L0FPR3_9EUKA|nr:polyadenylate-binding protein 1 [Sphaeroforma arctica JP610]KNC78792.1 polyadenylate-binding protein 1 [Sphaeroforma arctica JP610]|eukprot:XP_014152694.1 polyadenylate-binding protein 1 [Sphaeroforma arctica JP610]
MSATPVAIVPKQGNVNSTSLYVGDLHPEVNEALLFEIFNAVGPVASIRVCRDNITRRSLGYAYVNFHNFLDAERALDTMNYADIKEQPCRIMWSQRDPAQRKSGLGNVFIKNLSKEIDNKALYDTFSAFGNILSCKIVENEVCESLGYGFVHYESDESAENAIEKVNGMLLAGKKVFVGPFIARKERQDGDEAPKIKFTNVFVKNFPTTWDSDKLREVFADFGTVTSAVANVNTDGTSAGSGFVCFDNYEAAAKSVEAMNEKVIEEKALYCGRAQKKSEREAELRAKFDALKLERAQKYHGVNLYVKNLDDTLSEERVRTEFAPFGTITSLKIMHDDKGVSKGFGFVCFETAEEATKAVTEMNGRMLLSKPLYVALAQRKEDRKLQLQNQYAVRANGMVRGPAGMQPQLYPAGGPMFYTGPGVGVVPNGQMVGGRRWTPPAGNVNVRGGYAQMPPPGYMGPGVNMQNVPQQQQQRNGNNNRNNNGRPQNGQQPRMPLQQNTRAGVNQYRQSQGAIKQIVNPVPAVSPVFPGQEPLTASMLAEASAVQQKQLLGERLYPLIAATHTELAGKITGMLLEMDNSELLHLLETPDALSLKVKEAVLVLETHQQQLSDARTTDENSHADVPTVAA